ncbi:MAG: hypothetical protein KJ831_10015, partial [Candidatus Eisenbacteria bacterium]|nr:hypothetical protein [Candidatus Eisenbacteria bacterium]
PFSERYNSESPAQRLGLFDRKLRVDEILAKRLFATRTRLPRRLKQYYNRTIETRCIPKNRRHELKYAY